MLSGSTNLCSRKSENVSRQGRLVCKRKTRVLRRKGYKLRCTRVCFGESPDHSLRKGKCLWERDIHQGKVTVSVFLGQMNVCLGVISIHSGKVSVCWDVQVSPYERWLSSQQKWKPTQAYNIQLWETTICPANSLFKNTKCVVRHAIFCFSF